MTEEQHDELIAAIQQMDLNNYNYYRDYVDVQFPQYFHQLTSVDAIQWYELGLFSVLAAGVAGLSLVMFARWGRQIFMS